MVKFSMNLIIDLNFKDVHLIFYFHRFVQNLYFHLALLGICYRLLITQNKISLIDFIMAVDLRCFFIEFFRLCLFIILGHRILSRFGRLISLLDQALQLFL